MKNKKSEEMKRKSEELKEKAEEVEDLEELILKVEDAEMLILEILDEIDRFEISEPHGWLSSIISDILSQLEDKMGEY